MRLKSFGLIMAILAIVASNAFAEDRRASDPCPYVDNDSFTPLERDAYNNRNDPNTAIPGVTVAPIQSSTLTNPITVYPTSTPVYTRSPVYAATPVYYNQVMPSYGMGYSSMASYSGLPRRASDLVPYPENDSFTSFEKDIYNLRR
jgi:hypothetical protein